MPRCGLGTILGLAMLAATPLASAQAIDDGVVVLYVNAGVLWADPLAVEWGEANHCVLARGLTDAGAVIDDPARPTPATVPPDVLVSAWLNTGGRMLVAG